LVRIYSEITGNLPANYYLFKTFCVIGFNLPQMKMLRRTRVIVATSEKLTVWHAKQKSPDSDEAEKISVECPHCGEEVFFVKVERSESPEIEILTNSRGAG